MFGLLYSINARPPVFLFVVYTCVVEEESGFVKLALSQAIGLLPDNALVGLVSFGTEVQVHELGFGEMSKVYVFRGVKELGKEQVLDQLGLGRFLLPASDCEYTFTSRSWVLISGQFCLLVELQVALSVASGLLGACLPGTGARIIALVGGPFTEGPGAIILKDLFDPVRSHKDLDKDAAPYFMKNLQSSSSARGMFWTFLPLHLIRDECYY